MVPYSVFNYLAALTSVRFRDFLVGSFAIIPGCIVFVFLGAQSASAVGMVNDMGHREGGGDVDDPAVRISILVVGVVLAVAAVVLLGYYAKRELRYSPDCLLLPCKG